MKTFNQTLGSKLRELRKKYGYTQQNIGELLGVTFQQIQKYEEGKNRIPPDKLYRLKEHYRIDFNEFFTNIDIGLPFKELQYRPPHLINDVFYLIQSKRIQHSMYMLAKAISMSSMNIEDQKEAQ